ncbi:TetR/AcrR family transcriptional regulator [Aestuariibacter sp. A3R04]|uniref:TetR/AcrR family transcriptional regulator n=1 Tax=Aestuariibacter sp. A3R04 TaxID=2841571 RepID=UPI001C086030|nr:TetR/AcrR family transcriptional regulator [Aestuariibacter sp. A3R04]MBU3021042.1 TetR/AcrR family transcriptional regulator [Aestuariibacter sp. A3R04]
MPKQTKREQLIETAQRLFYQEGIKGTGIDRIIDEAGVAKRTLYNHFKSKDELIVATLEHRDAEFMAMLKRLVEKYETQQVGNSPFNRILAFFDAIEEWTHASHFSGCMFINASAEYPDKDDPVHVICKAHKKLVTHYIEELLSPLDIEESKALSVELALLADGAIVNAHTADIPDAASIAKKMAKRLLEMAQNNSSPASTAKP